jgi:voltage-gated sodium channel
MKEMNSVERFLESQYVHEFLALLVCINGIVLGLETSQTIMASFGAYLHWIDHGILYLFLAELIIRVAASGFRFLKSGWNLFDAFVIIIAFIPSAGPLSILRALRIFRVMRLISLFPQMRVVVSATISAVPGILSVAGILSLAFYTSAVIACTLFRDTNPEYFGTLGQTMFSLFQLMIVDEWGNIVRPIMKVHPYAHCFFIPFMIIMAFIILNLFFGLIVNAMQIAAEEENKNAEREEIKRNAHDLGVTLGQIQTELKHIKKSLAEYAR